MIRKIVASIAAAAALSIAVAGCATDPNKGPTYPVVGTVDQVQMEKGADSARLAYAAILHLMAEYVSQPRCGTAGAAPDPACSRQTVVNEMRRVQAAAGTATKGAQDLARSPTKTPLALANAVADASRAVELFRNVVAAYKPEAKEAK